MSPSTPELNINKNQNNYMNSKKRLTNQINSILGGQALKLRYLNQYMANPKFCRYCKEHLPFEKRNNQFCNQSHAAIYNNTGRRKVNPALCAYCSNPTKNKYCSRLCASQGRRKYNPEQAKEIRKNRVREVSANYRARLRNQTPPDADRIAIREFYRNCPPGFEVDHIIPISRGGLHTLTNLQYLSRRDNRTKSNKI